MYRIISGKWKGKKIAAPKNFEVRPTTDFAKEALFSILENKYVLQPSSVLDLFAGIGSISLEFASRGCKDITSIEMDPKHSYFIKSTAEDLGFSLEINAMRADVYYWLKKNKEKKKFDIIFLDPPFTQTSITQYNELIKTLLDFYLKENGIIIVEHQTRTKLDQFSPKETRKYGNVSFSFFSLESASL